MAKNAIKSEFMADSYEYNFKSVLFLTLFVETNIRLRRLKIMDISKKGLEIISRKIIRLAGKLYGRSC